MAEQVIRPAILARRHRAILFFAALFCLACLVGVAIGSYRFALYSSEASAANRLMLHVEGVVSSLEKYRLLTPLISKRPDILAVYSNNRDDEDIATALEALSRIGGMSGAADIELLTLSGEHFSMLGNGAKVSSDALIPIDRKDVREAINGRLGRALLINDDGRFYIFSSAARIDGEVVGIVSVHVDLNQTEQVWALSEQPIIASAGGRAFLTNRAEWLDAALHLPDEEAFSPLVRTDLVLRESMFGPLIIEWSNRTDSIGIEGDFVAASRYDALLGWTFYTMEPLRKPVFIAALACVTAILSAGLILGALWVVFSRQLQQLSQRRRDLASSLRLERRVRDRTRQLRQTQEGLIHSAKLAAIGQMSTILSHEYNQPLSAIRSYADNAQVLFAAGREEQGQDNLSRIGKLVDRLANLSKTLKTFARKPGADLRAVSVEMVVDEAVMLMMPRAKKMGVALLVSKAERDFTVLAGHTRLEQVLINLVGNSLDAIAELLVLRQADGKSYEPQVRICMLMRDGVGVIEVSDNGPGINEEVRANIFEPFVTSKGHGVGLGLGLPIAFNLVKGFGGNLSCIEPMDSDMSTTFEIALPLAKDGTSSKS